MEQQNPYAPPTAEAAIPVAVEVAAEVRPATQGKRLANLVIDGIITNVLSTAAGFVLGLVYGVSKAAQGVEFTQADEDFLNLLGMLLGFLVFFIYYIGMEALFHKTIGKLITGTRVVNADGRPPSFGQVVGRSFARMIPFEAFSFLGGNGRPVGWHDSLAKTRVVEGR
jgi:uncharacterized RDD family membrane protein YckC